MMVENNTKEKRKGKVWLVGAGPSDVGLFTLKGKAVLENAQLVVYDKLVGQGVIGLIPKGARKIDVGKKMGDHPVPQHEINKILLEEARAGNQVVRLKGGDPFLFGRGGEELELLSKHGIPFEIVPGVTSAIAVPAYNGIPVTHRDFCSSLHIITGHTKKTASAEIDYASLVKLEGTLVFLMGISAMASICNGLIEAGMEPKMPAAILEKGTTAHQRRVVSTLESLTADGLKAKIETPAIIVVGKVCALSEEFHWAEDRPLGQLKIMVTRPKERNSALAEKLRDCGAEVLEIPTIQTQKIIANKRLEQVLMNVERYNWVAFTSIYGVKAFFDTLFEMKIDIRKLTGLKFAAIGPATKKAIEEKGIMVDLVPQDYYGEALGQLLADKALKEERETGKKGLILIPRAMIGTENIIEPLKKAGVGYEDIPVYDTIEEGVDNSICYDETVDYVAFTSASTVRGFVKRNSDVDYAQVKALCIGRQTAEEAEKYGMQIILAEKPSIDSMVDRFLTMASEKES